MSLLCAADWRPQYSAIQFYGSLIRPSFIRHDVFGLRDIQDFRRTVYEIERTYGLRPIGRDGIWFYFG
jgi:hypothetical protein